MDAYEAARRSFRWSLPERLNIGIEACDRWAAREPERVAILEAATGRDPVAVTYDRLRRQSNRLAAALGRRGMARGDRVAVLLPQSAAVVIAHAGILKHGAVSVPLAALFGPDALRFRLGDSGARALVTDAAGAAKIAPLRAELPDLEWILSVDGPDGEVEGLDRALEREPDDAPAAPTGPDDPALMIYTSGTTGQPKGALHGHRVLAGHMPGFRFAHAGIPRDGDRMWTPADWAWAGGLLNALLPSLALGVPVVAWPHEKFHPEEALEIMRRLGVRNAFLPPTALRILKAAHRPGLADGLRLRSVMSAGETLGPDTFAWAREAFGCAIDELYGQTECNLVLGSSAALGVSRAGFIGKPVPGHEVRLLTAGGEEAAEGEPGEIAIRRPDPVMFLGYWRNEAATAAKFRGDWMMTGDLAVREGGYVRFLGRDDDIITSSGYRIGPGEIEDCLARHPAVAFAAAVGKPDPLRTEIVKAFIVLKAGAEPSEALTADIQAFVRHRLSAHEYPREVAYVASLPLTSTGKIIRRALRAEALQSRS